MTQDIRDTFACFVYIFVKNLSRIKMKQGNICESCNHAMFSFLESSTRAAKFSHDVHVFAVNAEAVKDNFKFELCLKSSTRLNRHCAET